MVQRFALHIQHQMAVTGNTMNVYAWKAVADGNLTTPLGADEHQFPVAFKLQRAQTDWSGSTLDYREQLVRFFRQT